MKALIFNIFIATTIFINFSYAQLKSDKCNVEIKIEIPTDYFGKNEYKQIFLLVKNVSNNDIILPKWLISYHFEIERNEIYFEFKKKSSKSGKYKEILRNDGADIDPTAKRRDDIKLAYNQIIKYKEDIEDFHSLSEPGEYKVRAIVRLDKLLNCKIYKTNWVEFTVK